MKAKTTVEFQTERGDILFNFRNPAHIEAALARQGITARRLGDAPRACWDCSVSWRGQDRSFELVLEETVTRETFVLTLASVLASATVTFDFYDLPNQRSRVVANMNVTSRSMIVTMALQGMRLIPGRPTAYLTRLTTAFAGVPLAG
jgi:hypothetical protein